MIWKDLKSQNHTKNYPKGKSSDNIKMKEDHQPTKKDTLTEIVRNIKKGFNKENFKKVGKEIKDFGCTFAETAGVLLSFPYTIPTQVRIFKEFQSSNPDFSLGANIGGWSGVVTGIAGYVGQAFGYHYLATHDHPEALLIPIATNVISAGWELGRKSYRTAKENLIKRNKIETNNSV